MRAGAKAGLVAGLIVVILASVAAIVLYLASEPQPERSLVTTSVERIDINTYKTLALPNGEWYKLGRLNGRYKHPETQEYTMVKILICSECGKKIPWPSEDRSAHPGPTPDKDTGGNPFDGYTCPFCHEAPEPDFTPELVGK